MLELLIKIETLCLDVAPLHLLGLGALATIAGLFLWLGGMYYSSFIIGFAGAAMGSAIGMLVSHWTGFHVAACAIIGAAVMSILAVKLQNVVIIILACLLFATASGTGYLSMVLEKSETYKNSINTDNLNSPSLESLKELSDKMETASGEAQTFMAKLKSILSETWDNTEEHRWKLIGMIVLGGIGGLVLIWFIKRVILGLCYSTVGSTMLIGGIQLMLLAKGVTMISALESRPKILPIILAAMILFGWFVQLFLVKPKSKKVITVETDQKG